MKKSTATMLSVIIFLTLSFSVFAKTLYLYPSSVIDKKEFNVIAHRGLNSLAPENSLSAFRLAGEYGFWGCEFDIYPTTDGKWAVMHDPTIDRMTNGSGSIMSMSWSELSQYRIDKGTNIRKYSDERIPELSQVLDICRKYSMHPVIEIKGGNSSQIKELCSYLSSRSEKKNFVITSFSNDTLKSVRKYMSDIRIWLLTFSVTQYDIAFCRNYNVECIDSNLTLTSENDIAGIISYGIASGVWTADSVSDMERLYSMGVRYVTTNDILPITDPAQTTKPTQPQTTKPTQVQTTKPTQPQTTKPTQPQTTKPTQVQTTKPTQAQTTKPTQPQTTKPTQVQTTKPTQVQTTKPTQAQTTKTTQPYTTSPSSEATIDEFLSEDSREMFKMIYKEAKKDVKLITKFF